MFPPPTLSFACSYASHEGCVKDAKPGVLQGQRDLVQKSVRLEPESSPAWPPSRRWGVWHAALGLLYVGQVAYFCAGTWGNGWNLEFSRARARLLFQHKPADGLGGHGLGKAGSPIENEFPHWLWGSAVKGGGFPSLLWALLLFTSSAPGQGISAWDVLTQDPLVKHLWGTRSHFRNLILSFIAHSLGLPIELSCI